MALSRDEQEARLPKWARDELARLRAQIARLTKEVSERDSVLMGRHPGTNVFLNNGVSEDWPLPKNSQVSFRFSSRWDNAIDVYHDRTYPGSLHVASLQGGLIVRPQASNAVRLERDTYR